MKKFGMLTLTVCLILLLAIPFASAATSGTCGDELTWKLTKDYLYNYNKTASMPYFRLTISGTGKWRITARTRRPGIQMLTHISLR